jgi:hypothetical protein
MKKLTSWMSAALAAATVTGFTAIAAASSHREAPAIAEDPSADNTDVYAWVQGQNLIIIANYIPLEEPAGGPNFHKFSDDVLYEIHLARGGSDLKDALTYQFRFRTTPIQRMNPAADPPIPAPAGGLEFFSQLSGQSQSYTVTRIQGNNTQVLAQNVRVAPPNIGPRTNAVAYTIPDGTSYEQFFVDNAGTTVITSLGNGQGRVFAGPRDDGFYVDLGGVFDLAGLRSLLGNPVDNVAKYNTHTIALEIPLTVANGGNPITPGASNEQTVGIWASASRRQVRILRKNGDDDHVGPWRQVSRLGLPLINEAVIGLQDKDKYNRTKPQNDLSNFGAYILNPIIVRDAEAVGFYGAGGPLEPCIPPGGLAELKQNRLDIVTLAIQLQNVPAAGDHTGAEAITWIGDVLAVDLGVASGFPNGRPILPGTNTEQADVTDVELGLLLCKNNPAVFGGVIPDGASSNDATFKNAFPFLASPWEGFANGHGTPAP